MGCHDVEWSVEYLLFAARLKFNVPLFHIKKALFRSWRYKQLLTNQLPTLEVQTVAFWRSHPYAAGTNSCFL